MTTADSFKARDIDVDANADGSFTVSIPADVGFGIQTLTQAEMLELCGWIIGKAAVRAITAAEPEPAPPADPTPRRPGEWTLTAHAICMPEGMRDPAKVREFIEGQGIEFLHATVSASSITFVGCLNVPLKLTHWLTAGPADGKAMAHG